MATWFLHRWLVVCDDEIQSFPTRTAARKFAAQLARHPGNTDIRQHGGYRNVDGKPQVIDLGEPNPYRPAGKPAYRYRSEES